MIKKRFGLIKNFSIPARLHTAGFMALIGVAVTCYAGYFGLQTSTLGLNASITATAAVMDQKQADMMHDALRADVLYALQTGPEGGAGVKASILNDVEEHIAEFEASFADLKALDLEDEIRVAIDNTLPVVQTYFASARDVSATAMQDKEAALIKFRAFSDSFSQLEQEMGILGQVIEAKGAVAGTAAAERNAVLQQVVLTSAAAAALILLVSNLLIARSITKPLNAVRSRMT